MRANIVFFAFFRNYHFFCLPLSHNHKRIKENGNNQQQVYQG